MVRQSLILLQYTFFETACIIQIQDVGLAVSICVLQAHAFITGNKIDCLAEAAVPGRKPSKARATFATKSEKQKKKRLKQNRMDQRASNGGHDNAGEIKDNKGDQEMPLGLEVQDSDADNNNEEDMLLGLEV